ncbi:heat-inducible transcriptional repressor HrcA [Aedoeadaptatus pacaensis]|uniref:heat-inducible transcriptional repressor HrcA n=1 Tax=Aedoeadaptatus pacaensis TaxID=1776390 RepID=UPI000838A5B8|nr:heat-inducible transcriptional repressor HrcA [Peptoniphilus pacaensis]
MDKRKIDILNLIIESYIASPVPVGSRTISKSPSLAVSSATIRNEMSDLEALGFLEKPHTSAGRVPSEGAYRFYVDELIPEIDYPNSLVNYFEDAMPMELYGTRDFYSTAVEALADYTENLALMMMPRKSDRRLQYLDLIPVNDHMVMLLIVGDRGVVVKRMIDLGFGVNEEELSYVSGVLSDAFVGTPFDAIDGVKFVLSGELLRYESFILQITEILSGVIHAVEEVDVVISGVGHLFRYEEFQDPGRMKSMMDYVRDKANLLRLFHPMATDEAIRFRIGKENEEKSMQDNSLISRIYPINGTDRGGIALIGPVRMNYRKSANSLMAFSDALSKRLGKER